MSEENANNDNNKEFQELDSLTARRKRDRQKLKEQEKTIQTYKTVAICAAVAVGTVLLTLLVVYIATRGGKTPPKVEPQVEDVQKAPAPDAPKPKAVEKKGEAPAKVQPPKGEQNPGLEQRIRSRIKGDTLELGKGKSISFSGLKLANVGTQERKLVLTFRNDAGGVIVFTGLTGQVEYVIKQDQREESSAVKTVTEDPQRQPCPGGRPGTVTVTVSGVGPAGF